MVGRRLILAAFAAVPLIVLGVVATLVYWPHSPPQPLAQPRAPILPDLAMPALADVVAAVAQDGDEQQVFFSASIANLGPGPFAIHAVRAEERGKWRISQRFRERDGTTTETITPGEMIWGGHGHNHWHVHLGASYALYTMPQNKQVRGLEKVGFCFFDQKRLELRVAGAPSERVFVKDACSSRGTRALDMGLSPGWEDPYTWALPDQRLDVTGLPDGVYRLVAKADPGGWFAETDETNNSTWVDVRLTTSTRPPRAVVIRTGPHV